MKAASLIFKYFFVLFLLICLGVHVYGLYTHYSHETTQSHITHLLSYTMCLLAIMVNLRNRLLVYVLAAVYPFLYHANCAWVSLIDYGKLNGICIYVVVMMPLGAVWVWKQKE